MLLFYKNSLTVATSLFLLLFFLNINLALKKCNGFPWWTFTVDRRYWKIQVRRRAKLSRGKTCIVTSLITKVRIQAGNSCSIRVLLVGFLQVHVKETGNKEKKMCLNLWPLRYE